MHQCPIRPTSTVISFVFTNPSSVFRLTKLSVPLSGSSSSARSVTESTTVHSTNRLVSTHSKRHGSLLSVSTGVMAWATQASVARLHSEMGDWVGMKTPACWKVMGEFELS